MSKQYGEISERYRRFIEDQQLFFVATAAPDGRVNVSPKGRDSLRVTSPRQVVWLNGTGSGNETAAHVLASPRMTLMFCSFVREPLILRLYGTPQVVHDTDDNWPDLLDLFPPLRGARNIFVLDVDLVQTSCGYGVPLFDHIGERGLMQAWADKKSDDDLREYHAERNATSLDGLPTRRL